MSERKASPTATVHGSALSSETANVSRGSAAFAEKADDLGALFDAVNDAANVSAGLWLSYLFVLFYLLVAVGGVTHVNLLFQEPVKLPFLNVDLPMMGFFTIGPLLFVIVHAYVLLHLRLLARKISIFQFEMRKQITDDETRARLHLQLPTNIFVQFLAGAGGLRPGSTEVILKIIAWISLVIGPLGLLTFFALQFLPYHDWIVLGWQRFLVAGDLALLWLLWSKVIEAEDGAPDSRTTTRWRFVACAGSALPLVIIFAVATYPGEWLDRNLPSFRFIPTHWPVINSDGDQGQNSQASRKHLNFREVIASMKFASAHKLLVAGEVDLIARKPESLWSNRLVLAGISADDRAKAGDRTADKPATVSLRGRQLEGAVFLNARLSGADFTAAKLEGARFDEAILDEAKFDCAAGRLTDSSTQDCAQLRGSVFNGAELHGASFVGADLRGAKFECNELRFARYAKCAQLQGASLAGAQLQGASLKGAYLQGAKLSRAYLQGAVLDSAHLDGADFNYARLIGASFYYTSLRGAFMEFAALEGADLTSANFKEARLDGAQLQGATLHYANLQGATLQFVELQGARLAQANLDRTYLQGALVWRADARNVQGHANIAQINSKAVSQSINCKDQHEPCAWTSKSFAALKEAIAEIPDGQQRTNALERIQILDPEATPSNPTQDEMEKIWVTRSSDVPLIRPDNHRLREVLRETGCQSQGAPYVIRGIIVNLRYNLELAGEVTKLGDDFLDDVHCPGASSLSNEDKVKLREISSNSAP